jgi:hypothetical protein
VASAPSPRCARRASCVLRVHGPNRPPCPPRPRNAHLAPPLHGRRQGARLRASALRAAEVASWLLHKIRDALPASCQISKAHRYPLHIRLGGAQSRRTARQRPAPSRQSAAPASRHAQVGEAPKTGEGSGWRRESVDGVLAGAHSPRSEGSVAPRSLPARPCAMRARGRKCGTPYVQTVEHRLDACEGWGGRRCRRAIGGRGPSGRTTAWLPLALLVFAGHRHCAHLRTGGASPDGRTSGRAALDGQGRAR